MMRKIATVLTLVVIGTFGAQAGAYAVSLPSPGTTALDPDDVGWD